MDFPIYPISQRGKSSPAVGKFASFFNISHCNISDNLLAKQLLSLPVVENLLGSNTSLTAVPWGPPELEYFANLNSICKELCAGIYQFRIKTLIQWFFFVV